MSSPYLCIITCLAPSSDENARNLPEIINKLAENIFPTDLGRNHTRSDTNVVHRVVPCVRPPCILASPCGACVALEIVVKWLIAMEWSTTLLLQLLFAVCARLFLLFAVCVFFFVADVFCFVFAFSTFISVLIQIVYERAFGPKISIPLISNLKKWSFLSLRVFS